MTFLRPELLWLLPLAGLPLVMNWLEQSNQRQISYPSLQWLDDSFRQRLRNKQRRRWLEILWRILLLACLVLLLARPIAGNVNASSDLLVLVVDNSLSMERESLGETSLHRANQWIQNSRKELDYNRLKIAVTHPTPQWIGTYSSSESISYDSINTRDGATSLGPLTDWLSQELNSEDARIIFLTDAQRRWFNRDNQNQSSATVEIVNPTEQTDNQTLQSTSIKPSQPFIGQTATIRWTTDPPGGSPKYVVVGSDTLVNPNQNQSYLTWTPSTPGWYHGYAQFPDDELNWDNRWWFTAQVKGKLSVRFIGQSNALKSLNYALGKRIKTVDSVDQAELVIMGDTGLPDSANQSLIKARRNDIPRIIMLGDDFNRSEFTRAISGMEFPWTVEGPLTLDQQRSVTIDQRAWFPTIERLSDSVLNQLDIRSVTSIADAKSDHAIMSAGEHPVLLNQDQWTLLTITPSQFVAPEEATAALPALLEQTLQGAVHSRNQIEWTVNQTVQWPQTLAFPLKLTDPEGTTTRIRNAEETFRPSSSGIYRIRDKQDKKYLMASNHPREEADLTPLEAEQWPSGVIPFTGPNSSWRLNFTPYLWVFLMVGTTVEGWRN